MTDHITLPRAVVDGALACLVEKCIGDAFYAETVAALRDALAEPVQEPVTKDNIIRMAREAGCQEHYVSETDDTPWSVEFSLTNLNVFADLVAAAEREACALTCESEAEKWEGDDGPVSAEARLCAIAIRARGEE